MSYKVVKEELLSTISWPENAEFWYDGVHAFKLCRFLDAASRIHPMVSYHGLKMYVENTYLKAEFPISGRKLYQVVNDIDMRRNQTLKMFADYNAWVNDPLRKKYGYPKPNAADRKQMWRNILCFALDIWPDKDGVWPVTGNE